MKSASVSPIPGRGRHDHTGEGSTSVSRLADCLAGVRSAEVLPGQSNRGKVRTDAQVKQLIHADAAGVDATWRNHFPVMPGNGSTRLR